MLQFICRWLSGINQPSQNGMEQLVVNIARVTRLLNPLIQEPAGILSGGFLFLWFLLIIRRVARRRKLPMPDVPVVRFLLGRVPCRKLDPRSPFFEEHPDP